jgi:hypothetical protein
MIHTGDSSEAKIFKSLDCESIVMLIVQRLVRNVSRKPLSGKNSDTIAANKKKPRRKDSADVDMGGKDTFDILETYGQYLNTLVRCAHLPLLRVQAS